MNIFFTVCIGFCGELFDLSFDLPFVDFLPAVLPLRFWIQVSELLLCFVFFQHYIIFYMFKKMWKSKGIKYMSFERYKISVLMSLGSFWKHK